MGVRYSMNEDVASTPGLLAGGGPRRCRPRRGPALRSALGATAATLAAVAMAVSGTGATTLAARTHAVTKRPAEVMVKIASVKKYGRILEDEAGMALYFNTANKPPSHFACTGACLHAWPPLVLPKGQKAAEAGKGVTGLGTVHGPSGIQVTWRGKPLYTFVRDGRGQVNGQGILHVWYVAQLNLPAKTTAVSKGSGGW